MAIYINKEDLSTALGTPTGPRPSQVQSSDGATDRAAARRKRGESSEAALYRRLLEDTGTDRAEPPWLREQTIADYQRTIAETDPEGRTAQFRGIPNTGRTLEEFTADYRASAARRLGDGQNPLIALAADEASAKPGAFSAALSKAQDFARNRISDSIMALSRPSTESDESAARQAYFDQLRGEIRTGQAADALARLEGQAIDDQIAYRDYLVGRYMGAIDSQTTLAPSERNVVPDPNEGVVGESPIPGFRDPGPAVQSSRIPGQVSPGRDLASLETNVRTVNELSALAQDEQAQASARLKSIDDAQTDTETAIAEEAAKLSTRSQALGALRQESGSLADLVQYTLAASNEGIAPNAALQSQTAIAMIAKYRKELESKGAEASDNDVRRAVAEQARALGAGS